MTTLAEALAEARARLDAAGLPDAAIESRLLIGGLLGLSATEVFVAGERLLSSVERENIAAAIERRLKREPVHRILGMREFYGMPLHLSAATLEPRPDTETLVDVMLPLLRAVTERKGNAYLLDLGTGTGAVALALLKECPAATALATDIAPDALAAAAANAARLGLSQRFSTRESNWFENISGRFDIIVSNPPYIRTDIIASLDPEVRDFDPEAALDGGFDGLVAYRAIAAGAADFLETPGFVGVEIGFDQRESVSAIFGDAGFGLFAKARDLAGNDRVLVFTLNVP